MTGSRKRESAKSTAMQSDAQVSTGSDQFRSSPARYTRLYSQINLPLGQLNLNVQEALAIRSDQFNLTITEGLGLFSSACIRDKLREICEVTGNTCAIIFPPTKTMLL